MCQAIINRIIISFIPETTLCCFHFTDEKLRLKAGHDSPDKTSENGDFLALHTHSAAGGSGEIITQQSNAYFSPGLVLEDIAL